MITMQGDEVKLVHWYKEEGKHDKWIGLNSGSLCKTGQATVTQDMPLGLLTYANAMLNVLRISCRYCSALLAAVDEEAAKRLGKEGRIKQHGEEA